MTDPATTDYPDDPPSLPLAERLWFNAIWFQSVWFCAVLGRDRLLLLTLGLLILHIVLSRHPRRELWQLPLLGGLGIAVDALLSVAGVYQFDQQVLVPLWLCALWLAFAATAGRSLHLFWDRPLLTAVAGAVVLPLNYWAGQRLGAVTFGYPLVPTLALIAVIWALLLPTVFWFEAYLARRSLAGLP